MEQSVLAESALSVVLHLLCCLCVVGAVTIPFWASETGNLTILVSFYTSHIHLSRNTVFAELSIINFTNTINCHLLCFPVLTGSKHSAYVLTCPLGIRSNIEITSKTF